MTVCPLLGPLLWKLTIVFRALLYGFEYATIVTFSLLVIPCTSLVQYRRLVELFKPLSRLHTLAFSPVHTYVRSATILWPTAECIPLWIKLVELKAVRPQFYALVRGSCPLHILSRNHETMVLAGAFLKFKETVLFEAVKQLSMRQPPVFVQHTFMICFTLMLIGHRQNVFVTVCRYACVLQGNVSVLNQRIDDLTYTSSKKRDFHIYENT